MNPLPHTRNCASHWEGSCDCADLHLRNLLGQIEAYHLDEKQRWQAWREEDSASLKQAWKERDEAIEVLRGVELSLWSLANGTKEDYARNWASKWSQDIKQWLEKRAQP